MITLQLKISHSLQQKMQKPDFGVDFQRPEGRCVAACGDFGLVMKAYLTRWNQMASVLWQPYYWWITCFDGPAKNKEHN